MTTTIRPDNRTWTDQPDEVRDLPVRCSLTIRHHSVEIRQGESGTPAYVTVGNLFGSETLRCERAEVVFAVLHMIERGGGSVPTGATICKGG